MTAILVLASCSGGDAAGSTTVVRIQPSTYNTQPQVLPSSTAAGGSLVPGGQAGQEQIYTVKRNDTLSGIASRYRVDINDIVDYNSWTDGIAHNLQPGDEIKIPPNAQVPAEQTATTEGPSSSNAPSNDTTAQSDAKPRCPDGELQGTYTIKDTDNSRFAVAQSLDVTVDELDSANADTTGYSSFYPGLKILVPCAQSATGSTA